MASTVGRRSRLRSLDFYRWDNGYAERQRNFRIKTAVDDDLDRHALDDLDEIAGRILRRECGKFRTRSKLDAVHMAFEVKLRIGVHRNRHGLPGPYPGELGFLEIFRDPNLGRNNRQDLLTGSHIIAHVDIAFGDPAILRGRNHGPVEV